tara:strand:- start:3497 stop:3784 length:288 start_codon:yes stop_codon:yes gene_type:complete
MANHSYVRFTDMDQYLSSWDLLRQQIPKIVRQNGFYYDKEVTGIEDMYRTLPHIELLESLNLNSYQNINNTQPIIKVNIRINKEKINLTLNVISN